MDEDGERKSDNSTAVPCSLQLLSLEGEKTIPAHSKQVPFNKGYLSCRIAFKDCEWSFNFVIAGVEVLLCVEC